MQWKSPCKWAVLAAPPVAERDLAGPVAPPVAEKDLADPVVERGPVAKRTTDQRALGLVANPTVAPAEAPVDLAGLVDLVGLAGLVDLADLVDLAAASLTGTPNIFDTR